MREIVKEAREVNEAIDLACADLGVDRDQIEFEIISLPKRGLLGIFGNSLAKVRVTVKEEPVKAAKVSEKKQEQSLHKPQPQQQKKEQPRTEKLHQEVQKPAVPPKKAGEDFQPKQKESAPKSAPQKPLADKKSEPPKRERVAKDIMPTEIPKKKPINNEPMDASLPLEFMDLSAANPRELMVAEYVLSVLKAMGIEAQIKLARTEKGVVFQLWGEGLGVVIGRRGETLDALQYLASLICNRGEKEYVRVTLDSGNYREKREQTLQRLAKRIAASVARTGRSTTLESMNPYERRIIHSSISDVEGVTSSSIGEEPNRRVVISSTKPAAARGNSTSRPNGPNRGRSGGGYNRGGNRPPRDGASRYDNRSPRSGNRPPRDNNSPRPQRSYQSTAPAGTPTPTDIDKEYAAMLPKEPIIREQVRQDTKPAAPAREKSNDDGGTMPLYGKIDL